MDYKCISADSHIDIVWLPDDLFVSEAQAHLKDKMPRAVETDEGKIWVADGARLGWAAAAALDGEYRPYEPGLSRRLDKMEEMAFFSDAAQGRFHPSDAGLRIKDQEADGVEAEVIYGILGVASGFSDAAGGVSEPDVLAAVYDIYNAWAAEFSKKNPQRLAGLACLSSHDPRVAARQLRSAAELGLRGAEINVSPTATPIYQKEWDVLWQAAAECNLPVSFHTTGLPFRNPEASSKEEYRWVTLGIMYTLFQASGMEFLSSILLSGACDRYPNFKFVLGECGVGWVPYILNRIDEEYEDRLFHLKLSMKPSEFWSRQGYTTFQNEYLSSEVIEAVGEGNILWGSDYPHVDGIWPDSQEVIKNSLGHLDPGIQRRLTCENAGSLYGFLE
jgi:predicted TIM-barrel fold metal-dependent hydrolase